MIKPMAFPVLVALTLILAAAPSNAQSFGVQLGGWMTTGAREGTDRAHGVRFSGSFDHPAGHAARWRLEGALVQARFNRDFPNGIRWRSTENSLELAAHLLSSPLGASAVRAFVGPIITVGIGCGTDGSNDANGRIDCGTDSGGKSGSVRVGAAAGLHIERGAARQFTVDLQAQGNSIAAARGSGPAVVVGFGLRFPR